MIQERQLCEWFTIEDCDYDFNFYEKKEIVSKMLNEQAPKFVEKFDSTGTEWDLWGDIDDYFELFIEGAKIETSTCIGNFIEDFLFFLPQLAYTDDKTLICPFDDEGSGYMFTAVPVNNNCIRVSVFHSRMVYEYNPDIKFSADIVIKKDTFLKQMRDILQIAADVDKKPRNTYYFWVDKIKYTIKELDKYFENPAEFKQNYEPKRHIRVFDLAYKTLKNKWKFEILLEGDEKANPMYWEKRKSEGKILDYDIFEQLSESLFDWNKEHNNLVKLSIDGIKKDLKPKMSDREEKNWVYSKDTKQWYSENEIMPSPKKKTFGVLYDRLKYNICINPELYSYSEDTKLEDFISDNYDINGNLTEDYRESLICLFKLKSASETVCETEFDYRNNKEIRNALKKAESGKYVRFSLGGYKQNKMHLWQQFYQNTKSNEAEYLTIACYDYMHDELYTFTADKKEFIDCFNKALDEIERKINVIKHVLQVGSRLKIKNKFFIEKVKRCPDKFEHVENFVGNYACVYINSLNGAGIINKNFEWVIKPESFEGIKGLVTKYTYLHNVDGKLFIAAKHDKKRFVMDIKGEMKILHVSDNVYYSYLNDKLYFIFADEDKTIITNEQGEDILTVNFEFSEKFWLFDDIIILSKNDKYGIIDWQGNVIIDFIFSDIKPDKNNLDFIPVKYFGQWGFVSKNGEIIDMKIRDSKDKSEA